MNPLDQPVSVRILVRRAWPRVGYVSVIARRFFRFRLVRSDVEAYLRASLWVREVMRRGRR